MPHSPTLPPPPPWDDAPEGWNWLAQDADGPWYWYCQEPVPSWAGGVWRAHSRHQQYAGPGAPNAQWMDTLRCRLECS